ncbi:hypothetical protein [Caballeronia arvi]|uniref:hypothetical protein n=1 Tax=Caballeronia arvi TaxID=1777135 RepID=UPI0013586950|nr:hypothetical protein [Caballeronia arvi]
MGIAIRLAGEFDAVATLAAAAGRKARRRVRKRRPSYLCNFALDGQAGMRRMVASVGTFLYVLGFFRLASSLNRAEIEATTVGLDFSALSS